MADQLTQNGLVIETAVEIKDELDATYKGIFGDSIGSDPGGAIPGASAIGQEIAILVDAKSAASLMLLAILAAFDPDQAEDAYLDILCALTGTRRKLPRFSTVLEACSGVIGTILPVGRVVTVEGVGTRFLSEASATDTNAPSSTLAAVSTNWANTTVYAVNDLVNNGGKIWQCIGAGTSGNPGPTGSGQQTDGGGVIWYAVGTAGQGVALVTFQAEQTGPLAATQGQLNAIATPVSGWAAAVNAAGTDAPGNGLGADLEGNAALRLRRVLELQSQGGGPPDAIRAAILAMTDVVACTVFVNNTDATDGNGLPPHSVDVMILAPSVGDQTLADAVWAAVGAGTATSNAVGTPVSKTVIDASGNPQTVKFSRPTPVPIFVQATVYYDAAAWQVGDVNAAVIAAAQSALCTFAGVYYLPGVNVRVSVLSAAIIDGPQATLTDNSGNVTPVIPAPAGSVAAPGIVDVVLEIHRGADPFAATPITITAGEIATLDPGDCDITPTPEVP